MKKLFLALSTAALVFGLGACTSKKSSSASGKTSTSTSGSQSQTSTGSQSQSSSSSEQGGGGGGENLIYLDFGTIADHWNQKLTEVAYSDHPGTWAYFFTGTSSVGNDWPGYLMTNVSGNIYSVEKQDSASIIFNVMGWQGDCQTVDLTLPTDGKNLFTINTSYTSVTSQDGEWSTYAA